MCSTGACGICVVLLLWNIARWIFWRLEGNRSMGYVE